MSHRIRAKQGVSWVSLLPKCPKYGKYTHPSEDSAERQLEQIEEARGADPLLNTFPCDTCDGWHVGRSSPNHEPRPRRHRRHD